MAMHKIQTSLVAFIAVISLGTAGCCCLGPQQRAETVESNFGQAKEEAPPPAPAPLVIAPAAQPLPAEKEIAPTVAKPIPGPVAVDLRQLAGQHPDLLSFDEATGRLCFFADVTFDSGSNVVRPEARAALGRLGEILTAGAAATVQVNIIGHTDSVPVKKATTIALLKELEKPTNNQGLSEARAEAVAAVLEAAKVDAARVTTSGVGESKPVASNGSAEGRAKNRRVEIWMFTR
jgi:outer membrane protein OmpA-like peptidoglycan-associated protein